MDERATAAGAELLISFDEPAGPVEAGTDVVVDVSVVDTGSEPSAGETHAFAVFPSAVGGATVGLAAGAGWSCETQQCTAGEPLAANGGTSAPVTVIVGSERGVGSQAPFHL